MTALASCQALPIPASETVGAPAGGAVTGPVAASGSQQHFEFDVDPLHASAFERPTAEGAASSQLMMAIAAPQVTYDQATHRTTVSLQMTNAGAALASLACQVGGNAHILTPSVDPGQAKAAGGTQTVDLVFDDPGADSFGFTLDLSGTPAKRGLLATTATPMPAATAIKATADSNYGTLMPGNAVDGNVNTQWANGGYRAPEAWLALDLGSVQSLTSLTVKMQPQSGGAYYQIEVSNDGVTYQPVTGNLKNSSWSLETKALPAGTQGRFMRLHFHNDPTSPEVRFAVFEAQPNGTGGSPAPSPSPTATPTPMPSATPTPLPTPTGTPVPTPTPTSSSPPANGSLSENFESFALGTDPSEFIDPNDEGFSYSWMPRVPWLIVSYNGSKQYEHNGLNNMAYLNFRRYRGTALGTPNGQLPAHYFAEVSVTPLKSYTYSPTGDQGTQFYYVDPTHYLELLVKPSMFEIWVANDAVPFTSKNWSRIYYHPTTTAAGQTRKFGAEIDTNAHSLKAYLDGELLTTLTNPILANQTHYLSLRGTGNIVVHDNLTINPM